ncbi:MAG: DNA alkylation repair protein [Calditrichia bacterium]
MKDGLNEAAIARIEQALAAVLPDFNPTQFRHEALDKLDDLELKERVTHLIGVLSNYLPEEYPAAADALIALKPHWESGDPDDNLRGFAAWPLLDYSATYGLQHPQKALHLFEELTSLFSAEFAIRPFYIEHFEATYARAMDWCKHDDHHVRRLASEGIRPLLPWGLRLQKLVADPAPILPLLELLKDDKTDYVRRSVANTLNDIAKNQPETVVEVCKRWQQGASPEREWVIRHATRTLVKAGHPAVFGLLGFTDNPKVELAKLALNKTAVQLGDELTADFVLSSTAAKPQKVVVDYAIHYMKASGKTSPKVFKFTTANLKANEQVRFSKTHVFRDVTTRKHYSGIHKYEVLINGKPVGLAEFMLQG